ncbi:hypothetical protein [Leptospira sarikeiensis]|uniref:Uncharacterized protein n=1 Tax=Leptospira sarikeiensis TaxID=2484943 RepID=A0A4R9K6J7_9LEPT|nr:hypothetical protein [Leptospira sarikeiensis]TGL61176.1 hypothetical protein EHQ64_11205 [Leptospira sarikeiensis]
MKMKNAFAIMAILLAHLFCSMLRSNEPIIPIINQAILERTYKYHPLAGNLKIRGYWSPNQKEINNALISVEKYLGKSLNAKEEKILNRLELYKVQIEGIIVNDRKVIYLNFFKPIYLEIFKGEFHTRWKEQHVFALGGGIDYWHCYFDILDNRVFGIFINGDL